MSHTMLPLLIALFGSAEAIFNCKLQVEDVQYDLSELAGFRVVEISQNTPPSITNTSWYFDACERLDLSKIPGTDKCPEGTQICGIQTVTVDSSGDSQTTIVSEIIPVSGDIDGNQSGARVSKIQGNDGVSVHYTGGQWGDEDSIEAAFDFLCAKDVKSPEIAFRGWDGRTLKMELRSAAACPLNDNGNNKDGNKGDGNKDDGNKGDGSNDSDGNKGDGNNDSDGNKGGEEDENGDTWGWFTWLFILAVLGFSAYVVASAWINYNRYGLSGVELLPHSDAVRDLPYLIRDFVRKLASTFAGSSNRGGYSAV